MESVELITMRRTFLYKRRAIELLFTTSLEKGDLTMKKYTKPELKKHADLKSVTFSSH